MSAPLDELIGRWLDGTADDAAVAALDAHLRTDPAAGERFARLAELHAALAHRAEVDRAGARTSVRRLRQTSPRHAVRRRSRRRTAPVVPVVLGSCAVAAALVLALARGRPTPTIRGLSGPLLSMRAQCCRSHTSW